MPVYLYKNESTGEIKEIYQGINDEHTYFEDGVEWKREWTIPNASIHTKAVDPFSKSEFMRATDNKKATIGDLLDRSKELSEQRAEKNGGIDPVKEGFYKKWSKERGGKLHPQKINEESKKKLAEKGISLTN